MYAVATAVARAKSFGACAAATCKVLSSRNCAVLRPGRRSSTCASSAGRKGAARKPAVTNIIAIAAATRMVGPRAQPCRGLTDALLCHLAVIANRLRLTERGRGGPRAVNQLSD